MARFTKTRAIQPYVVKGRDQFPLDMLRYDSAWPASEHDAALILASIQGGITGPVEVRLVRAQIDAFSMPAVDRWRSFGWQAALIDA